MTEYSLEGLQLYFLVGTGRCGTNLLNRMLRQHPDIQPITETHFISTFATKYADTVLSLEVFWSILESHFNSSGARLWVDVHLTEGGNTDKSEFKKRYFEGCKKYGYEGHRERILFFFQLNYDIRKPCVIVDKTPQYGLHIEAISKVFPEAKFIHLIRDGRYAATSMTKHLGLIRLINSGYPKTSIDFSYGRKLQYTSPVPPSLEVAVVYWERVILGIQAAAMDLDESKYLEVYYEALILRPVVFLERICAFLGLPDAGMWKWKAALLPRPMALAEETTRLDARTYDTLTEIVHKTLDDKGYFTGNMDGFLRKKSLYQPRFGRVRSWLTGVVRLVRGFGV